MPGRLMNSARRSSKRRKRRCRRDLAEATELWGDEKKMWFCFWYEPNMGIWWICIFVYVYTYIYIYVDRHGFVFQIWTKNLDMEQRVFQTGMEIRTSDDGPTKPALKPGWEGGRWNKRWRDRDEGRRGEERGLSAHDFWFQVSYFGISPIEG